MLQTGAAVKAEQRMQKSAQNRTLHPCRKSAQNRTLQPRRTYLIGVYSIPSVTRHLGGACESRTRPNCGMCKNVHHMELVPCRTQNSRYDNSLLQNRCTPFSSQWCLKGSNKSRPSAVGLTALKVLSCKSGNGSGRLHGRH